MPLYSSVVRWSGGGCSMLDMEELAMRNYPTGLRRACRWRERGDTCLELKAGTTDMGNWLVSVSRERRHD